MKFKLRNIAVIIAVLSLSACINNDFNEPEVPEIPEGTVYTISELKQMYMDSVVSGIYPEGYKFTEDFSVYCTCTMDDKSGNIYKSAYVQDATGAINLHLMSSGGIYIGDSIRLYLKGLTLGDYENMLQLDSVHVDNNMTKLATQRYIEPEVVTISQLQTGAYQAKLIRLEGVEFEEASLGETWADAENLETVNHNLQNCEGQTIIVRTSGYADFAGYEIPEGKGSIVAIVGQFRDDWQLSVRDIHEVDMDGYRCGTPILEENFDGVINGEIIDLEGWKNLAIQGTAVWKGINTSTLTAANFKPSDEAVQETWLISPLVEIPEGETSALSFTTNAANDRGGVLKVFVSTDFDGGDNPATATWTELPATICDAPASGFGSWTDSGYISLSEYTGTIHIAFKYEGTDVNNTEYYIDNFLLSLE